PGRGSRGGLYLAPAADLDPAPPPRAQAALARPAPAPVRPGQPDQLPLRRHRPGRRRLPGAGGASGRPVAGRAFREGRLMRRLGIFLLLLVLAGCTGQPPAPAARITTVAAESRKAAPVL